MGNLFGKILFLSDIPLHCFIEISQTILCLRSSGIITAASTFMRQAARTESVGCFTYDLKLREHLEPLLSKLRSELKEWYALKIPTIFDPFNAAAATTHEDVPSILGKR
jgi:hypothetical protein